MLGDVKRSAQELGPHTAAMKDPPGPGEVREFVRLLDRRPRVVWWELGEPELGQRQGRWVARGLIGGGVCLSALIAWVSWPWSPGTWWVLGSWAGFVGLCGGVSLWPHR